MGSKLIDPLVLFLAVILAVTGCGRTPEDTYDGRFADLELEGFDFVAIEEIRMMSHQDFFRIYRHQQTQLEFVLVPDESAFLMCRTECTRAAWEAVLDSEKEIASAELPVEGRSWRDCSDWCGRAGLRLPTESEWRAACRGSVDPRQMYCFYLLVDMLDPSVDEGLDPWAWFKFNSGGRAHPVRQKDMNTYGLYDVHGNVSEWCSEEGVALGGCWADDGRNCAVRSRVVRAGDRPRGVGFRPACSIR